MPRALLLLAFALGLSAAPAQDDADLPKLPNPVIVAEQLAGQLVRLDPESGELVDHALDPETALEYFLVYYAAGWSPTCETFTPALARFYEEQKAAGGSFEVIGVSVDDSEADMIEHLKATKVPWPSVRFGTVKVGARDTEEAGDANEEDDKKEDAAPANPLKFLEQAAGRGVPCLVVMDSRGLILAHSYKRRKEYLGAEKTLEEFTEILNRSAEERTDREREEEAGKGETGEDL